jgi:CBS domain-containing protein
VERIYQGLPLRELGSDAGLRRPTQPSSERVALESPALGVMTDFTRATPATIRPQAPLAGANQFMITRGVRLLLVVEFSQVQGARVGHVLETLRRAGRQHALVVERAMVRGIFSISQIARQLGVSVPAGGEVALTFSEIEAALVK